MFPFSEDMKRWNSHSVAKSKQICKL